VLLADEKMISAIDAFEQETNALGKLNNLHLSFRTQ
jgi:hypothetical protein